MTIRQNIVALLALLALATAPAVAADESADTEKTKPAAEAKKTAPAKEAPKADKAKTESAAKDNEKEKVLTVTVVSVKGSAEKLIAGGGKEGEETWTPLKKGDELPESTVIHTGFRCEVVLKFADRGTVVITSAAKCGIGEFRKEGDKVTARVGLKYGTMRASVEKAAGPNDFQVATPVATLSVRGTTGKIGFAGDTGLGIKGTSGTWNVASNAGGERNIKPGEQTNGNLTPPGQIASQQRSVGLGDVFGGLSEQERMNLINNGGGRGIIGFCGASSNVLGPPLAPVISSSSCSSSNSGSECSDSENSDSQIKMVITPGYE